MSSEVPERPWQKVGSDMFVYNNASYLVTVDYYSDFYELDRLPCTTATTVIECTKRHFSRYGIPEQYVSDNGPQYISSDFAEFAEAWDFEHLTSSPHHSQSNGKAECAVKRAKTLLKKVTQSKGDVHLSLLEQRNTPTEGVGLSPAQRLLSRRTRTLLPMKASFLQPRSMDTYKERQKLKQRQDRQAHYYNKHAKDLSVLEEGDVVRMKPFVLGQKVWQKGQVLRRLDERSYEIDTGNGVYRRNRVHIRKSDEPAQTSVKVSSPSVPPKVPTKQVMQTPPRMPAKHAQTPSRIPVKQAEKPQTPEPKPKPVQKACVTPTKLPRPQRTIKKPTYLADYVSK